MSDADETSEAKSDDAEVVVVDLPNELQTPSGMVGAIYSAIDAQRSVAIAYVLGMRRRQPDGTPADIIKSLERHYLVSVTASGTAVGATAFIPGAGTAVALGAGAAELLLQFELAALFGLGVAEVHGLNIQDRNRARAVILTLMLGQDGRNKVMSLATAAIRKDATALTGTAGRSLQLAGAKSVDDLPLAELLGSVIPADLMPSIVTSVQDLAKKKVPEKVAMAGTRLMPGGIGMLLGGIGGYAAGNDVVQASKQAFGAIPEQFPEWLALVDADGDGVPDPSALELNMRSALGKFVEGSGELVGASTLGISSAASAVGSGVATAASSVSRPFRSVDIDGDGIADEARALTAAKDVGKAAADAAGSLRGAASSLFKSRLGRKSADRDDTLTSSSEADA